MISSVAVLRFAPFLICFTYFPFMVQIIHQVNWTMAVQLFCYGFGCWRRVLSIQDSSDAVSGVGARVVGSCAVASTRSHNLMARGHVASRWRAVSGSLSQRTHAALCGQPFFIKQSAVWHFPKIASQAKMRHLSGASLSHIMLRKQDRIEPSNCNAYAGAEVSISKWQHQVCHVATG